MMMNVDVAPQSSRSGRIPGECRQRRQELSPVRSCGAARRCMTVFSFLLIKTAKSHLFVKFHAHPSSPGLIPIPAASVHQDETFSARERSIRSVITRCSYLL